MKLLIILFSIITLISINILDKEEAGSFEEIVLANKSIDQKQYIDQDVDILPVPGRE